MILKATLATALIISIYCSSVSGEEPKLPAKESFHLFLLAGQSNMAGRGKPDDISRQTNPRILALNKQHQWQVATDPLHWDKPAAGTGIGKPFAEIIASKNPSITIGLIPAACGGSSINSWQPGKFWSQTKSHPWDDSIARARLAMENGTLKAILWHQGEGDSSATNAPLHKQQLIDLINRFRKELNAPDLPFIIGQLGRFPAKPWSAEREMVDAAHQAVAKELKNVRFVPIENPESIGDHLHFDTPTLRRLAEGYASAYLELAGR